MKRKIQLSHWNYKNEILTSFLFFNNFMEYFYFPLIFGQTGIISCRVILFQWKNCRPDSKSVSSIFKNLYQLLYGILHLTISCAPTRYMYFMLNAQKIQQLVKFCKRAQNCALLNKSPQMQAEAWKHKISHKRNQNSAKLGYRHKKACETGM